MYLLRGIVASIERSSFPRKEKGKDEIVGEWLQLTYKMFIRQHGKADLIEITEMQSDAIGAPEENPSLRLAHDKGREIEVLVSINARIGPNNFPVLNHRIQHVELWEGASASEPNAPKVAIGGKEKVA